MVGYNLYGMQVLQRDVESAEGIQLFRDATINKKKTDQRRKQRERVKRSIMMMST